MNNPVDTTAPYLCTQETDLIPFFQSCVDKSKKLGNNVFSSITFETNYCDPLAILEQFYFRNSLFSFYEKPSEEFSVACGTPITIAKFYDAERFTKAKRWSEELFKKTFIAGNHLTECTGPTLFLNATFEDNSSDKKIPSLQIFLPEWQILRKEGSHFITINSKISSQSRPEFLAAKVKKLHRKFVNLSFQKPIDFKPFKINLSRPSENNDYEKTVEKALSHINKGNISKIVVARELSFLADKNLPAFSIAHSLRNKFPDCHTFCLATPGNEIFIGSTPETLTRVSGTSLETEAVAGTAPRGPSAGKDAHLGKTLLGEEKEILEHKLVIDSILRRLKYAGISEYKEGQTRLLRLANLQHVRTPLRAKIPHNIHPFEVISSLHPTPAMGGSPREQALPLIEKLEGFSRGWYSGVAGWFDSRGRGDFIVPIRCGKISSKSLTLYSGAGIVEGSIPKSEKDETNWKLQAMLEVITGSNNFPF